MTFKCPKVMGARCVCYEGSPRAACMNAAASTTRLPFHEWKANFRSAEAPLVRAREDYYVLYGRYCDKIKRAPLPLPTDQSKER